MAKKGKQHIKQGLNIDRSQVSEPEFAFMRHERRRRKLSFFKFDICKKDPKAEILMALCFVIISWCGIIMINSSF